MGRKIRIEKNFFCKVIAAFLLWGILGSVCLAPAASVIGVMAGQRESRDQNPADAVPDASDAEKVTEAVARLDDQQVRRLLIEELQKDIAMQAAGDKAAEAGSLLAGLIMWVQEKISYVRQRIDQLTADDTGKALALPESLQKMGDVQPIKSWLRLISLVVLVLVIGTASHLIWGYLLKKLRYQIQTTPADAPLFIKLWRLFQRALFLDAVDIALFVGATLVVYFGFVEDSGTGRLFLLAYDLAIGIVGLIRLASRLVLAPGAPGLRFLNMGNPTAVVLHRKLMGIAVIGAFGWLTCGLFRLQGAGEALHLLMVALIGLVIVLMMAVLVLQYRQRLLVVLIRGVPEGSLWRSIALNWHRLVIVYILALWGVWGIVLLLVGSRAVLPAVALLLSIPVFFILDQGIQGALNFVFRIVKPVAPQALSMQAAATGAGKDGETPVSGGMDAGAQAERVQLAIRRALRMVLGALILFWLLELWGIHLPLGKAVSKAAFSTIVTILLGYVVWELVKAPIERRLQEEMPEKDEEMEEGGSGGSRIGTLLLLLRKFIFTVLVVLVMLIVLSAIGVNIGPLIAGAGVVGLAIGFGAQTLVKDIISGIFFLVDDAFRVGDYIDTGDIKGMVEKISLRSMQLRHPRGMVHTVPFGDIKVVTNASRDYIISKLNFRVRYDTDVDKVRKIIKQKVYMVILKNEELAGKLLGKIKSQGVRELDDSAMIMRVKFKSLPGEQFVLRREVFRLMQEAFREEGIEFAHRNVTVYMPQETDTTKDQKTEDRSKNLKNTAAGAAALTMEPAKPQKDEKGG